MPPFYRLSKWDDRSIDTLFIHNRDRPRLIEQLKDGTDFNDIGLYISNVSKNGVYIKCKYILKPSGGMCAKVTNDERRAFLKRVEQAQTQ